MLHHKLHTLDHCTSSIQSISLRVWAFSQQFSPSKNLPLNSPMEKPYSSYPVNHPKVTLLKQTSSLVKITATRKKKSSSPLWSPLHPIPLSLPHKCPLFTDLCTQPPFLFTAALQRTSFFLPSAPQTSLSDNLCTPIPSLWSPLHYNASPSAILHSPNPCFLLTFATQPPSHPLCPPLHPNPLLW